MTLKKVQNNLVTERARVGIGYTFNANTQIVIPAYVPLGGFYLCNFKYGSLYNTSHLSGSRHIINTF